MVYDALFLALAEEAGTDMVTADYKLLEVVRVAPHAHLDFPLANAGDLISSANRRPCMCCNRTATGLVRAGTQWTKQLRKIIENRLNKRDFRTQQDALERVQANS